MRPNAIIPAQDAKGYVGVIKFRYRWDEPLPANGIWKATAQPGMQLYPATARVITPFNGTTPSVTVGTNGPMDNILAAADITEAGAPVAPVNTGVPLAFTVSTPIYVRGVLSGATAGELEVTIPFTT